MYRRQARARTAVIATALIGLLGMAGTAQALSIIPSNFNGTSIGAGRTIWFNSAFKASGLGTGPVHIQFIDSHIRFTASAVNYDLVVPDADIWLNPSPAPSTTSFSGGKWHTSLPSSGLSGNDWLTGFGYSVPGGGLPGGINPVSWEGRFLSDRPGVSVQWKWGAAVYTNFASDLNGLNVKAVDDNHVSPWFNSDHAGTPEAYKSYVVGGARGGGGSNWTGSYSSTQSATPEPLTPPVPEPGTLALVGTGLAGLVLRRRRTKGSA